MQTKFILRPLKLLGNDAIVSFEYTVLLNHVQHCQNSKALKFAWNLVMCLYMLLIQIAIHLWLVLNQTKS